MKSDSSDLDEARRQLRHLPQVLKCDHFLEIRLKATVENAIDRSQLEDFLSECNVQLGDGGGDSLVIFHQPHKKKKNKNVLFVGIGCGQSLDVDSFNGLVMGPSPASVLQASRFRNLWGESHCQVRRFQDGSMKEVVPISGPYHKVTFEEGNAMKCETADHKMDASDFVLHQLIHLIRVHCSESVSSLRVARPLAQLPNLLRECYDRAEQTQTIRTKTQEFVNLLNSLSSDKMPIRRAKARSGAMYGSFDPKRHLADSSVPQVEGGELKEKATCIPPRVTPLPIDIEITSKSFLRPDLYRRLSLYHLRQMAEALEAQAGIENSALCGDTLVVPYKSTLYGIRVQEGKLAQESEISLVALHELLQGVGTHHPCWWGALTLAHAWIDSQNLVDEFDALAADLIMAAAVFQASAAGPGSSKLIHTPSPPASAESAFTRFLYTLSFADFQTTAFFFNREDCPSDVVSGTLSKMSGIGPKRDAMPAVCLVTPRDEGTPGVHMQGLSRPQLKRIVNSARRTLFECLKGRHFEPTLEKAFTPPPHTNDIYDFRIELKAFKADPKTLTQTSRNLPVMDFDTVKLYLEELRASFEDECEGGGGALFDYNPMAHSIGVRVKDKSEIDAVIEDAKILGKGVVSHVFVGGDADPSIKLE